MDTVLPLLRDWKRLDVAYFFALFLPALQWAFSNLAKR
jgi:hypothetical protein